ncbi:complex I intermediate-associated protein 30 (CIA30) [Rubidibacter lacunae KORDI 51-2]|uniref:Complex I intermediate-associated protein 30 (CIA30) n=1 Tax=Rubidibacter lacunae KORDI 51-2 TaxID=582515 RepID=U5D8B4_9CHRO|nr:CIA30 family protein [Rubidibacter lacunae]ERN40858.1 complex I intermediate-associated protein 30 (CIA30) [Rubidibacter lacunae KORDI 51-2]
MSQRQAWDLVRFARTLTFFDTVPVLKDLDWLKQMILGDDSPTGTAPRSGLGRVLVVTANDAELLAVALRDRGFEPVVTSSASLRVEQFAGVRAAILADATPAAIALAARELPPPTLLPVFDFRRADASVRGWWGAVDDVVMGGVSQSGLQIAGDRARFAGEVSTANNGGFASVRTRNFEPPLDLSGCAGLELVVKGDGQRYKCILRGENRWDGIGYAMSFDTVATGGAEDWQTVRLPFAEFVPVFRAKVVDAPPFAPERTCALQLMLSKFEYDKALNPKFQPGRFALEIAAISAYRDFPVPQVVVLEPGADLQAVLAEQSLHWAAAAGGTPEAIAHQCAQFWRGQMA